LAPDLLRKKDRLEKGGARVVQAPVKENRIDLKALMGLLGDMEITSLLIEGGGRVTASSFSAGIVDKIMFFYAPKILGGSDGVPICNGSGHRLMKDSIHIRDVNVRRFGEDILVEGYVSR
jgi:diaminohydroxyphosphoribosylaminopyrimidine deaminase/5-amino-6-(5-phosphoribosylamino)uracil reductase